MSKTIEIKKTYLKNLILSFPIGFILLFGLEHFGSFRFRNEVVENYSSLPSLSREIPYNTKVERLFYDTYFGNVVETDGNGFTIADLSFSDTEFDKYSTKSYFYTQATIKDFKYGIYFSLGLFLVSLFLSNFKFKLS